MVTRKGKSVYYYAGGKQVPLKPADDLVAVDDARLRDSLPELLKSDAALRSGKPLRGGIRLLKRGDLAAKTLQRLQDAGATHPVFRQQGAVLVALPEIRVEDESAAKLAQARDFAAAKAEPTEEASGRLTLHALSNAGEDALALANELVEQYDLSATPRFLRVTPSPDVRA